MNQLTPMSGELEADIVNRLPRCRKSAGVDLDILEVCITSFNPLGKAGTIGINLLARGVTASGGRA